ncbi:MAG: hypothetical protein MUO97_03710 [Dehalococcoidia bacterium]|nr:hypothetical protein [Dehalococcoidia bacterium]
MIYEKYQTEAKLISHSKDECNQFDYTADWAKPLKTLHAKCKCGKWAHNKYSNKQQNIRAWRCDFCGYMFRTEWMTRE